MTTTTIGSRIRYHRKVNQLTQTALGEKIGVTFQQVQKYEKNINIPSVKRLNDIATALNISVSELMYDKDDNDHTSKILMDNIKNTDSRLIPLLNTIVSVIGSYSINDDKHS